MCSEHGHHGKRFQQNGEEHTVVIVIPLVVLGYIDVSFWVDIFQLCGCVKQMSPLFNILIKDNFDFILIRISVFGNLFYLFINRLVDQIHTQNRKRLTQKEI